MSESTIGWRELRWLFAAALSLLGMAAIFATALAGTASAKPKLELKSFQSDRTIQPGQTSALKISCGKGFNFLSTRFRTTTLPSDPSNPATRPAVELLGMVPGEKETKLTLKNVGAVPATVRGTVDCSKFKGKIASRSGDAEAAAKKKKPKLTTYVREKVKKVSGGNRAGAAKTTTLKVTCNKKNSIPADIGFKSKSSEFAGASYFKKKGELGVKGRFNTTGADKLKLYAACTKGKQVTLKGKVLKGTLSSAVAAPKAKSSAKKLKLTVSYGEEEGTLEPDVPFTGAVSVLGAIPRSAWWSPSFPTSLSPGDLWMGRGFLDPTSLPRSVGDMRRALGLISGKVHAPVNIRQLEGALTRSTSLVSSQISGFFLFFFGPGAEDTVGRTRTGGTVHRDARGFFVADTRADDSLDGSDGGGQKDVFFDFTDVKCKPGFLIDVFIPKDAKNPTHGLFNTNQPCPPKMIVERAIFEAGTKPSNAKTDDWKTKKTYRVKISSPSASIPKPFTLRVFWD